MKGCRPLTNDESSRVEAYLENPRDLALFVLGYTTGYRISELLSLQVQDVYQHGGILDRVSVARKNMKKKVAGRTVLLHPKAKAVLLAYITKEYLAPESPLFLSRKGGNISRIQAWKIFNNIFNMLGIQGKLGTHFLRKSYANKMYVGLDKDLVKLQKAMGHSNINSTVQYLSFLESDIDEAVLKIA